MYTWEIENLLKVKNYILNSEEYSSMISSSPQVKRVKYNTFDDSMETWTEEQDNSKKYFKYKVRRKEKAN